ncbi:hypothetical protein Btru_014575 [Bulinus truncatus]|nr:hypothetical protein Btru_014575 [Bulinus truncatus]
MNMRSNILSMLVSAVSWLMLFTCLSATSAEYNVTQPLSIEDRQNENSVNTSYDQELSNFLQKLQLLINSSSTDSRDSTLEPERTTLHVPDGVVTLFSTENTSPDSRDILDFIESLNQISAMIETSHDNSRNNQLDMNFSTGVQVTTHKQNNNFTQQDITTVGTEVTRAKRLTKVAQESNHSLDTSQVTLSQLLGEADQTYIIVVIVSVSTVVVLVIVAVTTRLLYKRCRQSSHKQMMLNNDFNRWDPQLLRPSQKSINAFYFGTPIPSVTEMIKV